MKNVRDRILYVRREYLGPPAYPVRTDLIARVDRAIVTVDVPVTVEVARRAVGP